MNIYKVPYKFNVLRICISNFKSIVPKLCLPVDFDRLANKSGSSCFVSLSHYHIYRMYISIVNAQIQTPSGVLRLIKWNTSSSSSSHTSECTNQHSTYIEMWVGEWVSVLKRITTRLTGGSELTMSCVFVLCKRRQDLMRREIPPCSSLGVCMHILNKGHRRILF